MIYAAACNLRPDAVAKGVRCHDIRHLSRPLWFEDLPQSFTSVQLSIS